MTKPFLIRKINSEAAIVLIRIMVGVVFLSEGIQKFLFSEYLGTGRFIKVGLPAPEFFGVFVPVFEILCGLAVLLGFYTRIAVVPLIIIMIVALISTKIPILLSEGFWKMAHQSRTDWSMLIGSIFLILQGGGKFALSSLLKNEKSSMEN